MWSLFLWIYYSLLSKMNSDKDLYIYFQIMYLKFVSVIETQIIFKLLRSLKIICNLVLWTCVMNFVVLKNANCKCRHEICLMGSPTFSVSSPDGSTPPWYDHLISGAGLPSAWQASVTESPLATCCTWGVEALMWGGYCTSKLCRNTMSV